MPLISLTSDLALNDAAISTGSSLLVIGASWMVGGAVVQLAKRPGAQIIAVVPNDPNEAKRLGADHVLLTDDNLGYKSPADRSARCGRLIDTVGGEGRGALLDRIVDDRRYVTTTTYALPPAHRDITTRAIQVHDH